MSPLFPIPNIRRHIDGADTIACFWLIALAIISLVAAHWTEFVFTIACGFLYALARAADIIEEDAIEEHDWNDVPMESIWDDVEWGPDA